MQKLKRIFLVASVLFSTHSFVQAQTIIYSSPTGTGTQCSNQNPCDLFTARNHARLAIPTASTDVIVRLQNGVYTLDSTFTLDARDRGHLGVRMIYEAASGTHPVISGGKTITGWTLFDNGKNIWRASVPAGLRTRQLYVNDQRAIRARGEGNPGGWRKSTTGFTSPDGRVAGYKNITNVEVVSLREWKCYRCPISNASGTNITLANPCWTLAQAHSGFTMDGVSWLENAFELLDTEGEWYLDESENFIYYKPRVNENMTTVHVVAPVLEILLNAKGTQSTSLSYLTIRGLTFAYATWMRPSSMEGYPDMQATYTWASENKAVSNVQFWYVDSLVLERNIFRALGGNGPGLEKGSRNSRISCNAIFDISGNGMHIGNITANPTDIRDQNLNITIQNNYVTQIGQEYHGSAGIFVGYVAGTRILANEIHKIPHMGIALGWGWGAASYMKNNEVAYNLIYDLMTLMRDGGGVYTLSPQPGTHVHHNYIHDQVNEFGALYPDEGSSFMRWDSNVVENIPRWLHLWIGTIQNDTVINNFYDNQTATINGTNCIVTPNSYVTNSTWPDAAKTIMAKAGISMGCQDIKTWVNLPLQQEVGLLKPGKNKSLVRTELPVIKIQKGQVLWKNSKDKHTMTGKKNSN